MRKAKAFTCLYLVLLLLAGIMSAHQISYQGKITDSFGIGVNGSYDIMFRIYDSPSSGTLIADYFAEDVSVQRGLFTAIMDVEIEESHLWGGLYLEVEFDGDVMSPRQKINAEVLALGALQADKANYADEAAFAMEAIHADTAGFTEIAGEAETANFADSAGAVYWGDVYGAPTEFGDGGSTNIMVDGHSWLSDSVILEAGPNITLSQTGNRIMISSLGSDSPTSVDIDDVIQNQLDSIQAADFWINGHGRFGGDTFSVDITETTGEGTENSPEYPMDGQNDYWRSISLISKEELSVIEGDLTGISINLEELASGMFGHYVYSNVEIWVKLTPDTIAPDMWDLTGATKILGPYDLSVPNSLGWKTFGTDPFTYVEGFNLLIYWQGEQNSSYIDPDCPKWQTTDMGSNHYQRYSGSIGGFPTMLASENERPDYKLYFEDATWAVDLVEIFDGNITAHNNLQVHESGWFGENLAVDGVIRGDIISNVTSTDTIKSYSGDPGDTIWMNANVAVNGELIADSIQAQGDYIEMDDNVNIYGELDVDDAAYFHDDVTIAGNTNVDGYLEVDSYTYLNDILTVSSDIYGSSYYSLGETDTILFHSHTGFETEIIVDTIQPWGDTLFIDKSIKIENDLFTHNASLDTLWSVDNDEIIVDENFEIIGDLIVNTIESNGDTVHIEDDMRVHGDLIVDGIINADTADFAWLSDTARKAYNADTADYAKRLYSDTLWNSDANIEDTVIAMSNFKVHGELIADSIQAVGDTIYIDDNMRVHGDLNVDGIINADTADFAWLSDTARKAYNADTADYAKRLYSDTIWSKDANIVDTVIAMSNFKVHGELIADSIQAVGDWLVIDDKLHVNDRIRANLINTDIIRSATDTVLIQDNIRLTQKAFSDETDAGDPDNTMITKKYADDRFDDDDVSDDDIGALQNVDETGADSSDVLYYDGANWITSDMSSLENDPIFMATDTEAELEDHLVDVTNIYTDNDGLLEDDDLTDNNIEELANVSAITPTNGQILKWDGSEWLPSEDIFNNDTIWANTFSTTTDTIVAYDNFKVYGELIADSIQAVGDTIKMDDHVYVDGDIQITGGIYDGMSLGSTDQILVADGTGNFQWQDPNMDDDWEFLVTDGDADTTLQTMGSWGIARGGNTLLGTQDRTHINLGVSSTTDGQYATVSGGYDNEASDNGATVGGGSENTASFEYATVSGGISNTASGDRSYIGGGYNNAAIDPYSSIVGGKDNFADGFASNIAGGDGNRALSAYSAIGGGKDNETHGIASYIGGGSENISNGSYSAVMSGLANEVNGNYSLIAGGYENIIAGQGSFIAGGTYLTIGERSFGYRGGIGGNPTSTIDVSSEDETFHVVETNFRFNYSNADADFRISSTGNDDLFVMDASSDAIGIGTALPSHGLHVNTDARFDGGIHDGTDFGSDGQILYTDGVGDIYWDELPSIIDSSRFSYYSDSAKIAVDAYNADSADHADEADHAIDADNALYAVYADSAVQAAHAYIADSAGIAAMASDAHYADTAGFAWFGDSSRIAYYAEYSGMSDSSNTAFYAWDAFHSEKADSAAIAYEADTAHVAGVAGYALEASTSVWADTAFIALNALNADSALHALYSDTALFADTSTHASHATNADLALFANQAMNAQNAVYADTALYVANVDTAAYADSALHALYSDTALFADTSTHASHATNADLALFANQAMNAQNAVYADTTDYALNVGSAVYADTAIYAEDANQAMFANLALLANHADSANYADTALYAEDANQANQATFADMALIANIADSATYADTAVYSINALYADTAIYAEDANQAMFANLALLANHADSANYADTALYAEDANQANQATFADMALIANIADSATYADTAVYSINALYADTSDYADYALNANHSNFANLALFADLADSAVYADTTAHAVYSDTADYAIEAGSTIDADTAQYAVYADSARIAVDAYYADTADYADVAG
ncbi:MAG: hypothetical protein ACLFSQ_08920, partial [Candidatus Zixiibacteriota bacterium]